MKTISAPAMAAIEAGTALVTGAVEITPQFSTAEIIPYNAEYDYFIVPSIIDANPPSDVVIPSSGFDSTGAAPFGHDDTLTPIYPIATAWTGNTSLWLKREVVVPTDGILTLSGDIENGVLLFFDDVYIGGNNYQNHQQGGATGTPFTLDVPVTAGTYTLKVLCLDEPSGSPDDTYFFVIGTLAINGAGTPIRIWGGYHPLVLPTDSGDATFKPIGARGGISQKTNGAIGGVAQGISLSLSGIEPKLLSMINDAGQFRGASVVIHRLIFDSTGKNLLDSSVWDRGRIDTIDSDFVIGQTATLTAAMESAARSLGRAGARYRADSDQRLITDAANDGYFQYTSYAGYKMSYWGGKRPSKVG